MSTWEFPSNMVALNTRADENTKVDFRTFEFKYRDAKGNVSIRGVLLTPEILPCN